MKRKPPPHPLFRILELQYKNIIHILQASEVHQELIEMSLEDFEDQGGDISIFFAQKKLDPS